jgi:hypothetical protein
MTHVLYLTHTGEIVGYESHPSDRLPDGVSRVTTETDEMPDRQKFIVDMSSLQIREMTAGEITARLVPDANEVNQAVMRELAFTDTFMPADRPLSDATRSAWVAYRQVLRDLSKPHDVNDPARRPAPVEMIVAWPTRPDGRDPIAQLRERIR